MAATPKRHCSYSIASAELAGCPNEGTHWLEGWGADLAEGWYCGGSGFLDNGIS
jgi:hypothetical protein